MNDKEAFEIVLDLARQNVIDIDDNANEHNRQIQAIAIVEEWENSYIVLTARKRK